MGYEKPEILILYIWLYCIVWWWIQDACKVLCVGLMKRYNWFDYNANGKLILPESAVAYKLKNKESDMAKSLKKGHH
jgi:H+-transporting ATPase